MSTADELEKLASLVERGFLTKEEFEQKKKQLLSEAETEHPAPPTPDRPRPPNTSVLRRKPEPVRSAYASDEDFEYAELEYWDDGGALEGPCPMCKQEHSTYKMARHGVSEAVAGVGSLVGMFFGLGQAAQSTARLAQSNEATLARCPSCDQNIQVCPACMTAFPWNGATTANCPGCGGVVRNP